MNTRDELLYQDMKRVDTVYFLTQAKTDLQDKKTLGKKGLDVLNSEH